MTIWRNLLGRACMPLLEPPTALTVAAGAAVSPGGPLCHTEARAPAAGLRLYVGNESINGDASARHWLKGVVSPE